MVRAFLAYALLVIGVPNYIGVLLGAVLMPLAWPFSLPARLYVIYFLELPKGVISILLARALFYFLHVPAHWAILAISIAWITFYFFSYKQSKIAWLCFTAGLIIGWFISPV
jgi:hypothetical protein